MNCVFERLAFLLEHAHEAHYIDVLLQTFSCRHCIEVIVNTVFESFQIKIGKHLRHHDRYIYQCALCLMTFPRDEIDVLNHHTQMHRNDRILIRKYDRHPSRPDYETECTSNNRNHEIILFNESDQIHKI